MIISSFIDKIEKRVAVTPEVVKKYVSMGCEVVLPCGIGLTAGFIDQEYLEAGAKIENKQFIDNADIYLCVKPSFCEDGHEFKIRKGAHLIASLLKFVNKPHLDRLLAAGVKLHALEQIPRITRAQTMDILSSQANIAGYKAVLEGFNAYGRVIPLMMTAAGTVRPAKVLILGAGVAGLQAIATAKRLGAIVFAFDVRAAVKEQVESLGATFVEVDSNENGESSGGYAKEMSDDYKHRQAEKLKSMMLKTDIVITTAQIPGKPAPLLITKEMFELLPNGSVIVDVAAETGGNCELTVKGESIVLDGKIIIGYTDYASRVACDSSQLFARNIYNFMSLMIKEDTIDESDEIIMATKISGE